MRNFCKFISGYFFWCKLFCDAVSVCVSMCALLNLVLQVLG